MSLGNPALEKWINDNDYLEAKAIVNDMSVVTDVAERDVKFKAIF